jgi:hypothetical protein
MENVSRIHRNRYDKPRPFQIAGWVLGGIVLAVVFAFLFGYFVMLLWNWIMPALFGLPEINYWMGFGIILLGRLIFGNFGPGHHKPDDHHKYYFQTKFRKEKFPCGNGVKKWHYYDDFWEEEGEKAFDDYIERKTKEKQGGLEKEETGS